jgi:hypothetical protein
LSRLAQRLESRGASGVVKFSSREAADLYNFTLILSANEGGLSISGEPNWLLEPTYSEHRINTSGSYLQTQNIDNLVNLNVSTSSGAWTLKDKQLRPLDGRGGCMDCHY